MHADNRPFSSKEDFMQWNEEMIEKYHPTDYHHSGNPIIRWVEGRRTRALLRMLAPGAADAVLDVGCGAGDILEYIPSGKLTGVDISPRLVREAQKRLAGRAMIVEGDAERLPEAVGDKRFTKVFCSEVLEHVRSPEGVLASIAAVTMPGGTVVVSIPNERLINRVKHVLHLCGLLRLLFGSSVTRRMDHEWHIHVFSKAEMCAMLERAGLRVTRARGVPFSWLPLRYVIAATPAR